MDGFLNKNDIVLNFPALYETSLVFGNDSRQNFFEPIGYNLGNQLVSYVAEGDGSEPGEIRGPLLLRDQGKERGVCAPSQLVVALRIPYHPEKIIFDYIPTVGIKSGCESIWARGAVRVHMGQSRFEFFHSNRSCKRVIIIGLNHFGN